MNEIPQTFQNISGAATNALSSVADGVSNIKNNIASSMSEYSSPASLGEANNEFLESNSIIAKIVFIIFVVILFNILLRLGMFLLSFFSNNSSNPYLIQGLISGNQAILVSQDPKNSDSVAILRSNNKPSGIECSWSVWLFINDLGTVTPGANTAYQHIFHKGTRDYAGNGISSIINGPGVYLSNNSDPTLHIVMDTVVTNTPSIIDINNIPLKKWFHLLVRLQNNSVDVYINGVISAHNILEHVPKQNYYDVYVCDRGGFSGSLSNLRYYAEALDIFTINAIVAGGPNLTPSKSPSVSASNPAQAAKYGFSYLSSAWYTARL
jgi:hypothetical protein